MSTLAFVGDVGFRGLVPGTVRNDLGLDPLPDYIVRLRRADWTVANLELPFGTVPSRTVTDPRHAALLACRCRDRRYFSMWRCSKRASPATIV